MQGHLYREEICIKRLLHAMLDNAIRESGQLYMAQAILKATEHGDVVEFLTPLAEAWLTCFLFPW